MKIAVVARKVPEDIRWPIAIESNTRFSRPTIARIQRLRYSSIAAITLRARMRGTRSTMMA